MYLLEHSIHAGLGTGRTTSTGKWEDAFLLRSSTATGRDTGGRLTPFQPAPATFTPRPDAWAIDSELDGRPGRGMQIDVQNNVLVLTLYAYDDTGRGTFYLTAGQLDANAHFSGELKFYDQGTPLGGVVRNAREAGTAGTIELDFSDGAHGTIRLPGEAPLAISKLNFGVPAGAEGLLGEWLFVDGTEPAPLESRRLDLDTTAPAFANFPEGVARSTAESQVLCGRTSNGGNAHVECQILDDNGLPAHYYRWELSGNEGDGIHENVFSGLVLPMRAWRLRSAQGRTALAYYRFSSDARSVSRVTVVGDEVVDLILNSSGGWSVVGADGQTSLQEFREQQRDALSIYLDDPSRSQLIQLDLHRRVAVVTSPGVGDEPSVFETPILMAH